MLGTVLKYRSYPSDTQNPVQYLLIGHTVDEGSASALYQNRSGIRRRGGRGGGRRDGTTGRGHGDDPTMEMSSWSRAKNVEKTSFLLGFSIDE